MGNTTSVSPSEDDDMNTSSGPRPNDRKTHQSQTRRKAPTPEEESENESEPEDTVGAIEANERIDRTLEEVLDDGTASATPPNIREIDKPSANSGSDEAHNRQQSVKEQMPTSKDDPSKSSLEGRVEKEKEEESKRLIEDAGSGSGTSSSGFYTNSSYSGSENSSEVYASGDDSDFVRNEKMKRGDDGRIVANGDPEASDSAELAAAPNSSAASNRRNHKQSEQDDVTRSKRGKAKRRKSSKTHYIKDETMRTLFGLVPYYGGGDGPMDQMIKATLASVGPNTIDVRDEEGNTLLILACQHCCEDLIELILAKGANPAAVNGYGGCPLHYTCYTYSMSLGATKALLLKGADPSATETTYGCTPLHYAASTGNADLCTLLLEHGAQQQACDFYNCTAAKYAEDAGHTAILELLGDGEAASDIYMIVDLNEMTPSMGLWVRYMDPQSELAYVMNDETGESWWEIDLLAVAKDFIKGVAAVHNGATSPKNGPKLPPLAVREWLVQGQIWACLVAIFSKSDPLRLMEVDLVMIMGKADFKGMVKAVLVRYGVKDAEFLRNALSPKLEPLGVFSLIPTADELSLAAADKATSAAIQTPGTSTSPGPSDSLKANEGIPKALTPVVIAIPEETSDSLEKGQTTCARPQSLQREPTSRPSPKRVESRATRRSEADKALQEALLKQKRDREEESKRQNDDLDEQRRTILSLEETLMKSKATISQAKEGAKEATSALEKLQSTLADDSVGQEATSCLSEEIEMLKASLAGERTQFSHITEVLEATTGSTEEWEMKQMAHEEERRVRLERIKSENDKNVEKIRDESSASLDEATQAWKVERKDLERGLMEKIEYARLMFEKATKDAAKVLSEETEKTNNATEDLKRITARIEKTKMSMHEKDEVLASSKQLEQTNKQLHSSLRREMERAKQLHNQIEDTKGQIRIYARVRPMNFQEKEAGYKEVCVKDGKQKLAFLKDAHQSRTFTHVFQTSLEETLATEEEQAEVYQQVSGLGTTLADGHSFLIVAAGATGSGKTMTLLGDQEEAKAPGGFFLEATPADEGPDEGIEPTTSGRKGEKSNSKRGKRQGSQGNDLDEAADGMLSGSGDKVRLSTTSLAGILPRLLAETFATLNHRDAHSAFMVWVSAVHVSNTACPSDTKAVESLLAPAAMGVETPAANLEGGRNDARNFESPLPAPPENHIWGRAVEASSPQEAMAIVEDARSRAASGTQTGTGRGDMGHILLRFVVKLVNRATNENSISEMVAVELAEEREGDTWPKALAEIVRAHAAATGQSTQDQGGGLLGMVRGCLRDTSKVLAFLCMSPADNQAERTQRTLQFGEACENSADNGASQLRELKKELARLKKESKSSRTITQSRLPRPASGREK